MKKILTITALVLLVASSLVAGTLAMYTKTLNPIDGTVTAKKFYIGATSSSIADVKLAPSESNTWDFDVVNTNESDVPTEVDMDLAITVDVTTDGVAIDGLVVGLYDSGDNLLGTAVTKTGTVTYSLDNAFLANVAATKSFYVKAEWQNGLASDVTDTANADAAAQTKILVTVSGSQHIE